MEQNKDAEIYRYTISLATQMGIKQGELLLSVIGNRIGGMNLSRKVQSNLPKNFGERVSGENHL